MRYPEKQRQLMALASARIVAANQQAGVIVKLLQRSVNSNLRPMSGTWSSWQLQHLENVKLLLIAKATAHLWESFLLRLKSGMTLDNIFTCMTSCDDDFCGFVSMFSDEGGDLLGIPEAAKELYYELVDIVTPTSEYDWDSLLPSGSQCPPPQCTD